MSHTWIMKGKFENQKWDFDYKKDIAKVIITMKCLGCSDTKQVTFTSKDYFKDDVIDLVIVPSVENKK